MKLQNFRRFDPLTAAEGRSGLQRGGAGEERIWSDFSGDPARLAEASHAIRLAAETVPLAELLEDPMVAEAREGRLLTRLHITRERSAALVERKKASVLKSTGRLACEACAFDFSKAYGVRGEGFIEAHHVRALTDIVGETKTRLKDLALLCANCHRMIHRRRPWLSLDELRSLIAKSPAVH